MEIRNGFTAYDVLAVLYASLSKEEERECAIQWSTAAGKDIQAVITKNEAFLNVILQSSANEYRLSTGDVAYLNAELEQLQQEKVHRKLEIYRLTIEVEHRIEPYFQWPNQDAFFEVEPLNRYTRDMGIYVYPCRRPRWNQEKSERAREYLFNTHFDNYMIIRQSDAQPFQFIVHYWNGSGLLKKNECGWTLSAALSPVMDNVLLQQIPHDTKTGSAVSVEGMENGDTVSERIIYIFDEMFSQQYSIIVFPEALGTNEVIAAVKARMRLHPEYNTIVLLPTTCENGQNSLTILGPGGVTCLSQHKTTPFIYIDSDNIKHREMLDYDRQIHLLITEELGVIAFPICAEFLDPAFYQAVTRAARADTIICPSFSPGIQAFKDTMLKGTSLNLLQFYVNTCSAKSVSRNGKVPEELTLVHLPHTKDGPALKTFPRRCNGVCSDAFCYFDLTITYAQESFMVEGIHKCA